MRTSSKRRLLVLEGTLHLARGFCKIDLCFSETIYIALIPRIIRVWDFRFTLFKVVNVFPSFSSQLCFFKKCVVMLTLVNLK